MTCPHYNYLQYFIFNTCTNLYITHLLWNEDDVNFGNTNLNEDMIVAVAIAI